VLHHEGPLLILAGAGSGKTRVLTHRIAHLLENGVSPDEILAITFTNKAAAEMKERVASLVGGRSRAMWVSTFHSACVRILRRDIERLGYAKSFTILDDSDCQSVVKACLRELNIDDKQYTPGAVLGCISKAKNQLLSPAQFERQARDRFEERVASIFRLYQRKLIQSSSVDFDDLIMLTVRILNDYPDLLDEYQERFRYIMVDEYQDTNFAQYMLIKLLAARYRNLCVVGDEDQGIYSWRGADISNILNFERDYPEARIIKLEQNYRSTQTILDAAYHVIKHNTQRKDKHLWTDNKGGQPVTVFQADNEHDEAAFIAAEVERLLAREQRSYRDFAVLYRTHAQSRVVEELLMQRRIPYALVAGTKFYDRREIKDILAYLRVLANPYDDVSLRRIINVPKRGIGDTTMEKMESFGQEMGIQLFGILAEAASIPGIAARTAHKVEEFVQSIENLRRQVEFLSITDLVGEILEKSGYREELEKSKDLEAQARLENISEFLSVTQEFDRNSEEKGLDAFLAGVALVSDTDTGESDEDKVLLMSLHSAKGLEFPVVFLIGLEDGIFPHLRALDDENQMEEERRLCYVGMTRAREHLYLTYAWERTLYGRTMSNSVSRFLEEIPNELTMSPGRMRPDLKQRTTNPTSWSAQKSFIADMAKTAQANSATGPKATNLSPGEQVKHKHWGVGTVLKADGQGENQEVVIKFPGVGDKRLVVKYAGLERLGG
ncbi:MAG: DNA helicase PcrA, partial [Bacillota bacterium]